MELARGSDDEVRGDAGGRWGAVEAGCGGDRHRAFYLVREQADRHFSELLFEDPDGGQGRSSEGGRLHVVEADHGHVLGHTKAPSVHPLDEAKRKGIVGTEDGGRAIVTIEDLPGKVGA